MKTNKLILSLLMGVACLTSCKDDENILLNSGSYADANDIGRVFKNAAKRPETFTVNASTGGEFTSSIGINYKVKANSLRKKNGSVVKGDVAVTVTEITKASEMILNDMPTNAIITPFDSLPGIDSIFANNKDTATAMGAMLNSFGEIKIEAEQAGEELVLEVGSSIEVEIPQKALPEPIVLEEIPMWDYVATEYEYQQYGHNSENQEESYVILGTGTERVQVGSYWNTPQKPAENNPSSENANERSLTFSIPTLGTFRNCDALVRNNNPTTVLGYFTNIYNDSTENKNMDEIGNVESNMLFFKAKDQNVCVRLSSPIINAPTGKDGFLSYQNSFSVGMEGAFLAISMKDGKFYAHKLSTTIAAPQNGKNYTGINFVLTEVSQSELIVLVKSMDNI